MNLVEWLQRLMTNFGAEWVLWLLLGLSVVSDTGELRTLCQAILDQNPKNVASYRAGKKALLGFFVGQAMKQSGGRANPELVSRLFTELLESSAPLEGS